MTRSVEIADEVVEAACRAHWDSRTEASGGSFSWDEYVPAHDGSMEPYRRSMRVALLAVLPYLTPAEHNHPQACCCPDVSAYPCPETCPACFKHGRSALEIGGLS